MTQETIKGTKQEILDIFWGDNEDFEQIQEEIVDERRWVNVYEVVVKRISDGKFFMGWYESQKEEGIQDQCDELHQVWPHEVKTIVYKTEPA